jgi:hypothetical protein
MLVYKQLLISWCFGLVVAMAPISVLAQEMREVIIAPDSVGILNNVINSDTLDGGERIPNTVYLLKRNSIYKITGEIQNPGFHLRIKAESASGSMPIIQPTAPSGGESQEPFSILGDFTMEGVYVTSVDDFGRYLQRMIRIRGDSLSIRLNNCWFDGTGQSIVRVDNVAAKIYMSDCIVSNVGRTNIPNNGRVIDSRVSIDSLLLIDNTFYNVTSRIFRLSDGRVARYAFFDHNTFVNTAQRSLGVDNTIELQITNNIFYNNGFLGTTRSSELIELENMSEKLQEVLTSLGVEQSADIRNNLFYTSPDILEVWADSIDYMPKYTLDLFEVTNQDSSTLVDDLTFDFPIEFKNAPVVPRSVITGMIFDQLFAENIDNGQAPAWNLTMSPFIQILDNSLSLPWSFPYDFSYGLDQPAATAATDGGQLGDRNWPLQDIDVVLDNTPSLSKKISAYPNPAYDILTLQIATSTPIENLYMMDLMGRKYPVTFIDKNSIDLSTLPSGLLLLIIQEKNRKESRLKIMKR